MQVGATVIFRKNVLRAFKHWRSATQRAGNACPGIYQAASKDAVLVGIKMTTTGMHYRNPIQTGRALISHVVVLRELRTNPACVRTDFAIRIGGTSNLE